MAEGHTSAVDSLPDVPRSNHSLLSRPRQHTASAPGVSLYDTIKSPGSSRCSSPRLKRSLDLIRVSRKEWEQRERSLSSLRAEKNELSSIVRQQSDVEKRYQQLQKACLQLACVLGCTAITEINGETINRVVHPKALQLTADNDAARKQIATSGEDLAKTSGELSSISAKLSGSESRAQQLKKALSSKEAEVLQLRNEVERLNQSKVHATTMMQTLEGQVKLLEGKRQNEDSSHCKKMNEIATLKQQLADKDMEIASLNDEISTMEVEKTELQERCKNSDGAYEEICIQLAEVLQVDQSDSCNFEKMLTMVHNLVKECDGQKLKLESLNLLQQATELDSKANRETILRLVADVKKHEEQSTDTAELQKKLGAATERLEKTEKDKANLTERLSIAQSSITALQQELRAKDKSQEDAKQEIEVLKMQNRSKNDEIYSVVEPYTVLCDQLRSALKCTSDEMMLTSVTQMIKDKQDMERQLMDSERCNRDTLNKLRHVNDQLKDTEDDLESQQLKLADMNQNVQMCEMLQRKLEELNDKHESFLKRLLQRLKVEAGFVLVGDFAEDAILVKIEQLSKHESQEVLEKQTAFYSIQRKLKSCRQQLEAKELQLGLSQRKVSAIEARLIEISHKEIEWKATIDKGKRVERQLERLQEKVLKQQETIGCLKADKESLDRLKVDSQRKEEAIIRLEGQLDSLQQKKIHLSQQLADARHRVQTVVSQDKDRADKAEELLKEAREEVEKANKINENLVAFKTAVTQLMSTAQFVHTDHERSSNQDDTLSQIEKLILACNRYREMSNRLQKSLKHLETGFKQGYQDTLTVLNN